MASEIERKFLVKDTSVIAGLTGQAFCQGYIDSSNAEVRIRIFGENATITLKSSSKEMIRSEYEYKIPVNEAKEILTTLCQHPLIEKVRYKITENGLTWEIDVFKGDNEGLIVAELETEVVIDQLQLPNWLGEEVTGNEKYYNANLAKTPFKKWK